MTNGAFDELFGGPPRVPETQAHAEGDGPRALGPGRLTRRSCCGWRARCTARPGSRTSAWPAASRSTASATAACCAKARSSTSGSSPPPATPAARSASAQLIWHRHLEQPAQGRRPADDAMKGAYLGPAFSDDEIERVPRGRRARRTSGSTARRLLVARRRAARGREGRRLVQRPHGVRPARARRAQHPRRPAQPADAGADEHEDQVPRGVPSVRAERAARARGGLLRAGLRLALHAAGRAGEAGAPDPHDRRAARSSGASSSSTCRAPTSRPSRTSTTRRASRR